MTIIIGGIPKNNIITKTMKEIDRISKQRNKKWQNTICPQCKKTKLVKGHCSHCKVTYFGCASFSEAWRSLKKKGKISENLGKGTTQAFIPNIYKAGQKALKQAKTTLIQQVLTNPELLPEIS